MSRKESEDNLSREENQLFPPLKYEYFLKVNLVFLNLYE